MARLTLLSNASATGSGVNVPVRGQYLLMVDGTFGGATVKAQMLSPDAASWLDITSASFTAEGHVLINLGEGMLVRAHVASGTPSAIYVSLDLVVQ